MSDPIDPFKPPSTPMSLAVSPLASNVSPGETVQFQAIATLNDSSTPDVTASCVWTSSDATIATVDAAGLATGVAAGAVSISAVYQTPTASVVLTVTQIAKSLAVEPLTASVAIGATQQFQAIVTFSDSTTFDVTELCAWTSSQPQIAQINNAGLAIGLSEGVAAVSAVYETTAASVILNIEGPVIEPGPGPAPGPKPIDACAALVQARAQMALLLSGQAVAAVDTPQLGRVEFTKGSAGELQRLIDTLAYQCAIQSGDYCAAARSRRRPISVEAWP